MRRAAPTDDTDGDADPLSELVERLLANGLEEKLCVQLAAVLSGESLVCTAPQPSAGKQVLSFWAGQAVLEATYLLESVFLLFYSDGDGMAAGRFTSLLTLFHATLFSTWPLLAAKLGWASEWLLRRLRHLAALILIEGMHLERLLEAMRGPEPAGTAAHPLLNTTAAAAAHAALVQLATSLPGAVSPLPDPAELNLGADAPQALLQLAQALPLPSTPTP
jgi:hypothetical protein